MAWWSLLPAAVLGLLLTGCGGNGGNEAPAADTAITTAPAELASGATTLSLQAPVGAEADVMVQVQPAFHVAPLVLDPPDDADAADPTATAHAEPRRQAVPARQAAMSTRRLTLQTLEATERAHAQAAGTAKPQASGSIVATYSPAQIRAAYGLPALPASFTGLTAAQAAQLGAGQTIYIVDAMHNPNAAAELAAFNAKFGLPGCTTKPLTPSTSLPLPKASAIACEFSVAYSTAAGAIGSTAPAYDAGWATEIALDVQWAHATAPLARIVLIEAPDASLNSLLAAVRLANAMGPGVVSMSFGAAEGSYTASVDSVFTAPGMTYLAATGDSGAGVSWPSVSPNVVAVGGTTLTYSGSGARTEIGWSGTGGGMSAYTAAPSYQAAAVPGLGNPVRRTVADVAFNADPSTGQYTAVMSPGASTPSWLSVGGTSLSTPQWAGLVAVANAVRAQAAKAALGAPHAVLYGQIGAVPSVWAASFADVVKGAHGSCGTCTAKAGYDPLTGLGTPNATALLSALSGAGVPPVAPVVTSASIAGQVGTALSFTASATSANPVSWLLSGAPSGMAISSSGLVTWATPVAGTYAVTAIARDSVTGLSGQGLYTVTIAAKPAAPVVASATVSGKVGTAFSFAVGVTAANPVTYALSGQPAGMSISTAGVLAWANPVAGSYAVTVTATDSKTGLSGRGVVTVQIAAASTGPVITAAPMTGVAGKPITGTIAISDPGVSALSVTLSGVPVGMTFSVSGMTFTANWVKPVAGNYTLKVAVLDSLGRSATASVPVTVSAK